VFCDPSQIVYEAEKEEREAKRLNKRVVFPADRLHGDVPPDVEKFSADVAR
jgi:hypothetical protein